MIFLTVGHQTAFDRLVRLVDEWASQPGRTPVFAQIGNGTYRPKHMEFARFLTRAEFQQRIDSSVGVVAHAGVGTIIQVLLAGKPLLVLPRLVRYEETRSDHQVPTTQQFASRGLILAGYNEEQFIAQLDRLPTFRPAGGLNQSASPQLLSRIREFIGGAQREIA